MIVINKIDAENVDLPGLVGEIRERFARSACCWTCRRMIVTMSSKCWSTRPGMRISIRSPTPIAN